MSFYHRTIKRSVSKLINKQYPEDDFVLDDDDILVLTKVDISCNNFAGDTHESDDSECESQFDQFYTIEDAAHVDNDSDMDDFIDDRPESELYGESDECSDDQEEDREYDSESENENEETENEPDSENETNHESENERDESDDDDEKIPREKAKKDSIKKVRVEEEKECDSESEDEIESGSENDNNNKENKIKHDGVSKRNISDDDEKEVVTPSKKRKTNVIEDDTSESSGDADGDDIAEITSRSSDSSDTVEDGTSESSSDANVDDIVEISSCSSDGSELSLPFVVPNFPSSSNIRRNEQTKDVNKFGVYLLPKIDGKRTCLRYYGRIGMGGIAGHCRPMTKKQFCDLISRKRVIDGFTRLNLLRVNARHLEYRQTETELPKEVRKFAIHIIDQWFPLGIPLEIHLDRAIDLLECLKREIGKGNIPNIKHSNKFYELIPHQGDPRRRPRFMDVDLCDSKLKYVRIMREAIIDCFSQFYRKCRQNPLDYFIEHWLRIELNVLEPTNNAYQILEEVIENTQHPNSSPRFCVANIFKVDNMNPEANGDFSTNITTNHRYLFHYTFATNLPCILREGLFVAPTHIHSVNRFLGKGIYFWDAIANAGLNYQSLSVVYVLVCRVALGNIQQVKQLYLQHGKTLDWNEDSDSLFCSGSAFSSSRENERDLNGAKIYCGNLAEKTDFHKYSIHKYSLYNEYVVRNKNQVSVEYIVKLEKQ